jgi:hypothetical protein
LLKPANIVKCQVKYQTMKKSVAKIGEKTKLTATISSSPVELDGMPVSYQQSFAIEMGRIGPEEMKKALADSENITSLLRQYPKEMSAIVNDILAGRIESAKASASRIGLTEEAFQEKGGGMLFWIGIAFCAGAIFAAAAFNG